MQVDNSGTVIVFDEKTTQAIEEGKNRVTLLQVEELRLKKLKKSLETEVIKLEADINAKNLQLESLEEAVDTFDLSFKEKQKQLASLENKIVTLTSESKSKEDALQLHETAVHEKELSVNAKEAEVNSLNERVQREWGIAEKAKAEAEDKVRRIDYFIKSL